MPSGGKFWGFVAHAAVVEVAVYASHDLPQFFFFAWLVP